MSYDITYRIIYHMPCHAFITTTHVPRTGARGLRMASGAVGNEPGIDLQADENRRHLGEIREKE